AHTTQTIAEVALALGYADARSFRRAFKRWTGQLPTALRTG
ncbi:AraC family transcriptional regulator, partial [Pelomonas sp. HMWF004]